jgi:hypothetical protein
MDFIVLYIMDKVTNIIRPNLKGQYSLRVLCDACTIHLKHAPQLATYHSFLL